MVGIGAPTGADPGAGCTPKRRAVGLALVACVALAVAAGSPAGALAAPSWLAPTGISNSEEGVEWPRLAVDPAGETVSVWSRDDGHNEIVQASARPAGGPWQPPTDLSVPGADAEEAQVAIGPEGEAVAVWEREEGGHDEVQASVRPAGGDWQRPPTDLSPVGVSTYEPELAIDAAGEGVAVWGQEGIIEASACSAGGSWLPAVGVSLSEDAGERPQVAIDAAGEAVAVWESSHGTDTIQSSSRPAGGAWAAPVDVSAPGSEGFYPQVAFDAAGEAVAVWEGYDGTDYGIDAAARPVGGSWQGSTTLSAAGGRVSPPHLALDPLGQAVAVWGREEGSDQIVQAAVRPPGGSWQPQADLSGPGTGGEREEVALTPGGEAVVLWEGAGEIVQAAARSPGGSWQQPVAISLPDAASFEPSIAADAEGDFVAAWGRRLGTGAVVESAARDAVGPRLRSLSIPATGEVGVPLSFSVFPFDVWSAPGATGWSFGDGGAAGGTAASHTYSRAGVYTVTVTSTDAVGNASTATGVVAVGPAPGPAPQKGRARAARIVKVRGGSAVLLLACGSGAGCAGTARISVAARGQRKPRAHFAAAGARGAHNARRTTLGIGSVHIAAGPRRIARIPLTRAARMLIRARGRGGLAARLGGTGVVGRGIVLKGVGHRSR